MPPAIEVDGLFKRYGDTRALEGLTMRVESGSIYGFVGPNGAGKTTTMRILATLIEADRGSCRIGDTDVARQPARVRAHVGYMPDFFGVYEDLTVQEYLEFYAESYYVPVRARRATIDDLLDLVDLKHKRREYVEALSRGMKQRLGLARCLVHDPAVLLLDEPASGMDPRARVEMREIVKELRRLGKTVLISSHILPELAELCTHIGIIQDGRLLREGRVAQVLSDMSSGKAIDVRAFAQRDMVIATLKQHPAVVSVEETNPSILTQELEEQTVAAPCQVTFRTFADEAGLRDILRALVEAELGVITFSHVRDNLEDVFMQITEGRDE